MLKDIGAMRAGDPFTAGTRVLRDIDYRCEVTDVFTERVEAAGFVVIGRSNCPELANTGTTEPIAFGPTRNPWDLTRTAGGSSGGTGAAVASRMVAVGHGNDGGGSMRVPSSANGVVGLKPSRGRVTHAPGPEAPGGFAVDGFLCRTVRDSAATLDVIAGSVAGDPHPLPLPDRPYRELATLDPGPLRIGVMTDVAGGPPTDPRCVEAVQHVARMLEQIGHRIDDSRPRSVRGTRCSTTSSMRGR